MRNCKRLWRSLLGVWLLWGCLLGCYEQINMQIPKSMWIYEKDAVQVLSDEQKKISPKKLRLDFAGNVRVTKKEDGNYRAVCRLFGMIPLKTMELEIVQQQELFPGGIPVGIYVQTDGVFVVGTGQIETETGLIESPAQNIIKTGDYITHFQGEQISGKKALVEKLKTFSDEKLTLGIRRGKEAFSVNMEPVYTNGQCQIGVWVRDDMQGIGMLTYVTEDQKFGALGHGISDTDSSLLMEVSKGKLYDCEVTQITRGRSGEPGRLSGKILYRPENYYGSIYGNESGGIYGKANEKLLAKIVGKPLEIALKEEVKEEDAVILSSVDGSLKKYKVQLTKVHKGERDVNKGIELCVTDEALLALTGGIVQGMSGSPILQNGKIVGAVTHVLVNDPTRGYGIFIENMLEAAK